MLWPVALPSIISVDLLTIALGAPALCVVLVYVALGVCAWHDKHHQSGE